MSRRFAWHRDGGLLAALVVAALLASGVVTGPSQSAARASATPTSTDAPSGASATVTYWNAVGSATAVADVPDTTLAALLSP